MLITIFITKCDFIVISLWGVLQLGYFRFCQLTAPLVAGLQRN